MRKNIVSIVICISLAITLFACGGGSSGGGVADTMTVTVSGPSGTVTTTYTEGSYNAQGHLDPNLMSYVTGSNNTFIELHNSWADNTQWVSINIAVRGNTSQSYPIDLANDPTFIFYDAYHQSYASIFSSPSGTITLSSIGNVGEKITGAFDALLTSINNTSDTVRISGTFSVTRGN